MRELYRALILGAADDIIRTYRNLDLSDGILAIHGAVGRLRCREDTMCWVVGYRYDPDSPFSIGGACEALGRRQGIVSKAIQLIDHACGGSIVQSYEASPVDWSEVNQIYRGLADYLEEKDAD